MYTELIGKNVELILAFSTYTLDGGASPEFYYGVLMAADEQTLKLEVHQSGRTRFNSQDYTGETMIINRNYVVALRELL